MMRYLKHLVVSWKTWQYWKQTGLQLYRGFIPSETYLKYPPHCTFDDRKVLNVGCGRNVYAAPNVTNTDLVKGPGVDVALDLSKPLPFENDSFDFIIANHVLEHVPSWWECFKELSRVLKPGGKLEIWIPPVSSDSSFTYRDHINRIGLESFAGTANNRRSGTNLFAGEEFKTFEDAARMRLTGRLLRPCLKWWVFFAPDWLLEFYSTHLRNTVSEEGFFFTKESVKG
jgi:SAM-dependent methyltransferase